MKAPTSTTLKFTSVVLAIFLAGIVSSCNKVAKEKTIYMKADVANGKFYGSICRAYPSRVNGDTLLIEGYNTADKYGDHKLYPQIQLYLADFKGIGTYPIGGTFKNAAFYYTDSNTVKLAIDGSITMSTLADDWGSNKLFTGTFYFTCADGTAVKNGALGCGPYWFLL